MSAREAKWVKRRFDKQEIVGSNPITGIFFKFFLKSSGNRLIDWLIWRILKINNFGKWEIMKILEFSNF